MVHINNCNELKWENSAGARKGKNNSSSYNDIFIYGSQKYGLKSVWIMQFSFFLILLVITSYSNQ